MSIFSKKLKEVLHVGAAGYASPSTGAVFYETADIPLADVMKLYERNPTCKSSVDLLLLQLLAWASTRPMMTIMIKRKQAKMAVDEFCEDINLDTLLNDMAKGLSLAGTIFGLN